MTVRFNYKYSAFARWTVRRSSIHFTAILEGVNRQEPHRYAVG